MKLQILSDLHMDGAPWSPPKTDARLFVVAGDLYDDGLQSVRWCAQLTQSSGKPAIFVPGNHDFYGSALGRRLRGMRDLAKSAGVYLLHNRNLLIDGVRFVGTPLWSDFELEGPAGRWLSKHAAADLMGDFHQIRTGSPDGEALLTPDYTVRMHERAKRALLRGLEDAYSEKVVVVTHHAPSVKSLSSTFRYSALNGAYASRLDDFVANSMARLWVHGHLHRSHDYVLGGTRVLCNPRGSGHEFALNLQPPVWLCADRRDALVGAIRSLARPSWHRATALPASPERAYWLARSAAFSGLLAALEA